MPPVPLIGLAHGSRHPAVRDSLEELLGAVAEAGRVPTAPAFLDLTAPDLLTAATRLAGQGHRRAVVVPLLFTEAYHATIDTPQAVRAAAAAAGLELVVAGILGTGEDVRAVVEQAITAAGVAASDPVLLFAVGSSNARANLAVADLAARIGGTRPGRVEAGFGTTEPRGLDRLAGRPDPLALVPLFVSPGLLLDPISARVAERGGRVVPPLGARVAPVVLARYRSALG